MDLDKKRENEKKIFKEMLGIYCRGVHKTKKGDLCSQCKELLEYSSTRTDKCPFMETKTFCSACTVRCYSNNNKEKVKEVMKYSGPRMMYHHPVMALKHIITTLKSIKK